MKKLIKFIGYGFLALLCWKCVDSTLCTSRTIAPVFFDLRTIEDGEAIDTVFDSLTITGKLNNEPLDTNLIDNFNVTNGQLLLAPLENQVIYTFKFNNLIDVDFAFFYQQTAEFLNDACGFIYEYTIDSLKYDQKNFSYTYTIPPEFIFDTTFKDTTINNVDTILIDQIDTTVIEAYDTTIQVGEIIDSVIIQNPEILIDNVDEQNIEIYIHPFN